jgi:allophanate hydrolase
VVAGFDAADPYSKPLADRPVGRAHRRAAPGAAPVVRRCRSEYLYDRALEKLGTLGEIVEIDIAAAGSGAALYGGPWVAERTAAIAGILASDPDAVDTVRKVVEPGRDIGAVELFNGIYRLAALKRQADLMWDAIDVLAPHHGHDLSRGGTAGGADRAQQQPRAYTNFVNLLDMAAVAVPAGARANATGFGITLIGPADTDQGLLTLANDYLAAADLPPPPPLDLEGRMQTVKLAVVGAHLKDMPLHWQLTSREATFVGAFEPRPRTGSMPSPTACRPSPR